MHIEFLLEEPSAEAFFAEFLPRTMPEGTTWNLVQFKGKSNLLAKLESRLKAYAAWLPDDWRIVVLVDEDRQDCAVLKNRLEVAALTSGLITKTKARGVAFQVLNRIAVEELEAWFFGDVEALISAYPGVPASLGSRANFRDPDAVPGGTWEAIERTLQRAGHFAGGLGKIELARTMGKHMEPSLNRSASFQCFMAGLAAL